MAMCGLLAFLSAISFWFPIDGLKKMGFRLVFATSFGVKFRVFFNSETIPIGIPTLSPIRFSTLNNISLIPSMWCSEANFFQNLVCYQLKIDGREILDRLSL